MHWFGISTNVGSFHSIPYVAEGKFRDTYLVTVSYIFDIYFWLHIEDVSLQESYLSHCLAFLQNLSLKLQSIKKGLLRRGAEISVEFLFFNSS